MLEPGCRDELLLNMQVLLIGAATTKAFDPRGDGRGGGRDGLRLPAGRGHEPDPDGDGDRAHVTPPRAPQPTALIVNRRPGSSTSAWQARRFRTTARPTGC